jgi:hypothetical protein
MACAVASGLLTALQNDGVVGYNPFVNFNRRESQQFINGSVRDLYGT